MNRDTFKALAFAIGAAAVLGIGAWLFFTDGPRAGSVPSGAGSEGSDARRAGRDEPRIVDIPRCPLRVRLDRTFEREETEHESPNLRVVSRERAMQIDLSCRRADEDFERAQFLDETLQAVKQRYEGDLDGERELNSGPATGWTTWRSVDNQMRLFNVLVRDENIVTVHVFGPDIEPTQSFNRRLVEKHLRWPGAPGRAAAGDERPERADATN